MASCLPCMLVLPLRDSSRRMSIFFGALALITVALVLGANVRAEGLAPTPPKGKGERCVESVEFMRRHHMEMLKHQRGETVHRGARDSKFSLKGCVDCHAVNGADGKPVSFNDSKHFCRSCHDYAAVKIDCFECHASRPGESEPARHTDAGAGKAETAALADYLKGTARQPSELQPSEPHTWAANHE
jgi:predicted CXXCH cytochrome family protein